METNVAPEKIYLDEDESWHLTNPNGDSVEYIRTDTFMEKAENFFTETFDVEDYNDILDVDGSPIFNYNRFIEDFINSIKGE